MGDKDMSKTNEYKTASEAVIKSYETALRCIANSACCGDYLDAQATARAALWVVTGEEFDTGHLEGYGKQSST